MHVNEEFQWLDLDNRQKNVKSLLKYLQWKGCSIIATLDIRFSSLSFFLRVPVPRVSSSSRQYALSGGLHHILLFSKGVITDTCSFLHFSFCIAKVSISLSYSHSPIFEWWQWHSTEAESGEMLVLAHMMWEDPRSQHQLLIYIETFFHPVNHASGVSLWLSYPITNSSSIPMKHFPDTTLLTFQILLP